MIAVVGLLLLLVLVVVVVRARRRRKARSAAGVDAAPSFVVLTAEHGRDRHRVPARRLFRGSGGAM